MTAQSNDLYDAYLEGKEVLATCKQLRGQLEQALAHASIHHPEKVLTDPPTLAKMHNLGLLTEDLMRMSQVLQMAEGSLNVSNVKDDSLIQSPKEQTASSLNLSAQI